MPFQFKQFFIDDSLCAMKVSTDAVLFGCWANANGHTLDIGTGSGVLSLILAQRFGDIKITGIDIDSQAVMAASTNAANSPFYDRIRCVKEDVNEFVSETKFQSIICNPPYFDNNLKAEDARRSLARHTDSLSFAQLAQAAWRLADDHCNFSLIIPAVSYDKLVQQCCDQGWILNKQLQIFTKLNNPVSRYLLQFGKHREKLIKQSLSIHQADGGYSDEFISLTKDFYLKF
ncbi:tRNA1(Val) (adenine(37)-N6)-methyltransferase [Paraferrimonas sp. SM1919]|uniref:tRNA1(Val) (adenine(37)-N6)-methyltransferase n=1 Tax=Paraferrimonas sp. SM1919 TaxID=2662263 RepID=UPI0013D79A2C|nr:methyltransferase [Paraferrimonas sp. SM1919]